MILARKPKVRSQVHVLRYPVVQRQISIEKFEPIVDEAKALGQLGAKELCLIAEDTNQWGMDLRRKAVEGCRSSWKR